MRTLIFFGLVLMTVWLQTGFFGYVRPLGVMPNLMLVLVVVSGMLGRATPTLAVAVGGGFLLDLASGSDFGLRMAFYSVVALGVIAARQFGIQAESLLAGLTFVLLGTLVFNIAVIASAGQIGQMWQTSVWLRLSAELFINSIMLLGCLLIALLIQRRSPVIHELGLKDMKR